MSLTTTIYVQWTVSTKNLTTINVNITTYHVLLEISKDDISVISTKNLVSTSKAG